MSSRIYTAPPNTGTPARGKTLPALLYEAQARYPNPRMFNQPEGEGWTPMSLDAFRVQAEETALGLLALGLERGDRVAFYLESDVYFCIADMGCLIAGLINVPIYLTHGDESVTYVINHAGAKALFVANPARLAAVAAVLAETPAVETVIVAEQGEQQPHPPLPEAMALMGLEEVRTLGQARLRDNPASIDRLLAAINPGDLATIIYTSGTTGQPKGVMLSHENLSFNAVTSVSGLPGYQPGPDGEIGLSFLPLTHVFARTMHYGYVAHGVSVYFTTPDALVPAFAAIQPTMFATVPRVLEKIYSRIMERAASMTGLKKKLLLWALSLARRYELGQTPSGLYALQLKLADKLVFSKWRAIMGGRVEYIICGGAAFNAGLNNLYAAAGIQILQGYGLTETSPVIAFNRPGRNRAGTVGEPIPDVEVMIDDDGEICTRGPHIMLGYYKNDIETRKVIDPEGWFHTGDIGEFTDEGFLRITDRKKDLFKLSTGKYVMPQPLENKLTADPLVEQAVVVGSGYKYATALIFPAPEALRLRARAEGLDETEPLEALFHRPRILAAYQELVDRANEGMDHWSTIKRFTLIAAEVSIENGLLTPTMKVKRSPVSKRFADEIEALYADEENAIGTLHP